MDQTMNPLSIQTVNVATKFHYLKKAFTVLVSISIFSFFISYSSWLPLLVHSLNLYFNLYSINRSYMFLIFNGILAFLARNSGLILSSPFQIDRHDEKAGIQYRNLEVNYDVATENAIVEKKSNEGNEIEMVAENGGDAEQLEAEEEQEDELIESSIAYEGEEEDDESLSTEELNKKFDEFIKKMREEIMFESQRLIMV
ncbi:hypothetical protein Sjap_025040 [Stephania japonica]|uniref:DUF4408 domain-containing protein n=1 Tax=Stephania japonica TaxID=461633 RepID=A0AAP0HF72_9MAGN